MKTHPATITTAVLGEMAPLDVHALFKMRVDIFVHEQQCPFAEIDDTDADAATTHFLAHAESGELVGTARLFPAHIDGRQVVQFGRFALAPSARGTGLGSDVVAAALNFAAQYHPGLAVYLDAQAPLTGYYEKYGFQPCGKEFLEDGIPHIPMLREAD